MAASKNATKMLLTTNPSAILGLNCYANYCCNIVSEQCQPMAR